MKPILSSTLRVAALFVLSTGVALAADPAPGVTPGWGPIGAGIGIGLAVLGGGLGQGKTASAALEGMARNPQAAGSLLTPMIIGLALIESLVLLGFIIANTLTK